MNIEVPAKFTLDQLIAHLQGDAPGSQPSKGFHTTHQWAKQFGIGVTRMRILISEAKQVGAIRIEMISQERIDGRPCLTTAYAFDLDKLQGVVKVDKKRATA